MLKSNVFVGIGYALNVPSCAKVAMKRSVRPAWSSGMAVNIVGRLIASRKVRTKVSNFKREFLRLILCVVVGVMMLFLLLSCGCSTQITARADVYYPKENGGNAYLSRETFHYTSWNKGNSGGFRK